jgi:hypothetical protein
MRRREAACVDRCDGRRGEILRRRIRTALNNIGYGRVAMTLKRATAHSRRRHSALTAGLLLMAALAPRATEATELRVFSTGAPLTAAKAIAVKFSAETGHTVAFTIGQPATIQQKLAAGEQADVVVVPAALIAPLEKDGKLRVGSGVNVARVGIGVVVRAGAPRPDVVTPASIRKLLMDAPAAPGPAGSLVQALSGPAAREAWMAAGMEPVSGRPESNKP